MACMFAPRFKSLLLLQTDNMSRRQRRQILREEDYQNNLSQIIRRDYFPDLNELERDAALQTRREAGDFCGAVAVRRAARRLNAHEESLAQQEEQEEHQLLLLEDGGSGVRQVPRPLHRESLAGFHARVTSQDNAEFEQTQTLEIKERRRQEFLALTNTGATSVPAQPTRSRHPLVPTPIPLASDQFNPPSAFPPLTGPSERQEPQNSLFFVPEARQKQNDAQQTPLTLANAANDTEEAQLALVQMPPPPAKKQDLVEYIPKAQLDKKIEPSATRFPKQQIIVRRQQQQDWDVRSDTTGTDTSEHDTDLDSPPAALHVEQRRGRKRKLREQESLVQMTPLIVPNASPIVTWGTVGGTPTVLPQPQGMDESSGAEESSFRLPEESKRDLAAAEAQARVAHRARRSKQAGTPQVDARASLLSPAARALLQRSSRPMSARSASSFGSALRSSYTTTTRSASGRMKSSAAARNRDSAHNVTPRIHANGL